MVHYRLSQPAVQDLADIAAYIAEDNPQAAVRMIDIITGKFEFLAAHPKLLSPQPRFCNLHKHKVGRYVIFFRPVKNGIEVIRVLHGARDIEKILWQVN